MKNPPHPDKVLSQQLSEIKKRIEELREAMKCIAQSSNDYTPLDGLPYRFRYQNGQISQGGFKTFESAVKHFMAAKGQKMTPNQYGLLFSDLKDVVCVENEREY